MTTRRRQQPRLMTLFHWLNYEQLFSVLRAHGFTSRPIVRNGEVWEHSSGAELMFPAVDLQGPVISYHYSMARAAMSDYGIMTDIEYELASMQAADCLPAFLNKPSAT